MRSVNKVAVLAALGAVAAGCGNYSTEDLRFLSALPTRPDMTVQLPSSTGAGPTALFTGLASTAVTSLACPAGTTFGDATVWQWAKPTSDKLNEAVAWIVGLIDHVRRVNPTHRADDVRRWGPFGDDKHPGHEIQIVMERSWPAGAGGPPRYDYRFEARVTGSGQPFTPVLYGWFVGASASRGNGDVTLAFDAFWAVGINDAGTPRGTMHVVYDRASDPVTIGLDLVAGAPGGFGVESFGYGYAGYATGSGAFDYAFKNASGDRLGVAASYAATNAGMLHVNFTGAGGSPAGAFNHCFDGNGCLVYVDDPANLEKNCAAAPCSLGLKASCAAVPVAPF